MGFKRRGLALMTHEGVVEGELTDHIACMASEVGKRSKRWLYEAPGPAGR